MTDLKISRPLFNQTEEKPKPIEPWPCARDFSRALSKLRVSARNSDWFLAVFALVVVGRSNYFGIGFSTVTLKRSFSSSFLGVRHQLQAVLLFFSQSHFGRSVVVVSHRDNCRVGSYLQDVAKTMNRVLDIQAEGVGIGEN